MARLARLEAKAALSDAPVQRTQVLMVDPHDGRMTDQPYDHLTTTLVILWHNHRDPLDLRVWGDPDYAIDWSADDETRQAQIDRQRAHLGIGS